MNIEQLKEILRAAKQVTKESEFFVIGSAAILNVFESPAHHHLSRSIEADLISVTGDPKAADLLSAMIGELSAFHEHHNVYAEGVTFETPVYAPQGWKDRASRVQYEDIGVAARFMELHDLTLSKLGAGRPKDLEFCAALAATGYLNPDVLQDRLAKVKCTEEQRKRVAARIARCFATGNQ